MHLALEQSLLLDRVAGLGHWAILCSPTDLAGTKTRQLQPLRLLDSNPALLRVASGLQSKIGHSVGLSSSRSTVERERAHTDLGVSDPVERALRCLCR